MSIATMIPDMKAQCGHAGFLMQGRDLKRVAIAGGLSRAQRVGRAIRTAAESGGDTVGSAAEALEGWVLFRGHVVRKDWESREGYMFGTTTIEGTGEDTGHRLRIWFKNENHVTWRDERPWVLSPDLIMVMHAVDGTTYTNTLLPEGAPVGVVGAAADPQLRSDRALALLGPRHYGYELNYTPIERLVGR